MDNNEEESAQDGTNRPTRAQRPTRASGTRERRGASRPHLSAPSHRAALDAGTATSNTPRRGSGPGKPNPEQHPAANATTKATQPRPASTTRHRKPASAAN